MPTPEADAETFTMANVAPQVPRLNRGLWEQAESKIRDLAVYLPGRGAAAYVATNEATPAWQVISLLELKQRSGVDVFPALPASVKATAAELPMPGSRRRS